MYLGLRLDFVSVIDKYAYTDSGKRGRLFFLAVSLALSVFVVRAMDWVDVSDRWQLLGLSASYFAATYFLLLWGLKFQFTQKTLLLIIPQSAMFVAAQSLFVTLFFTSGLNRLVEFLFLITILIIMSGSSYVSFLMTNVFNVSAFKPIPLVQVARTASYIVMVLTVYFVTYALLKIGVGMELFIVITAFLFSVSLLLHFFHIEMFTQERILVVLMCLVGTLALSLPGLFLGTKFELTALLPASVCFAMVGLEMSSQNNSLKSATALQYLGIIFASVLVNIVFQSL